MIHRVISVVMILRQKVSLFLRLTKYHATKTYPVLN